MFFEVEILTQDGMNRKALINKESIRLFVEELDDDGSPYVVASISADFSVAIPLALDEVKDLLGE